MHQEYVLHKRYTENLFLSFDGLVLIDGLNGVSEGYNLEEDKNNTWYIDTYKLKEPKLSKINLSPVSGGPVILASYPILDDNENLLSLFGYAIELNGFSNNIVSNSINGDQFKTIVVDQDANVIASADTSMIFKLNLKKENKSLAALHGLIESSDRGTVKFEIGGVECLGYYFRMNHGLTAVTYVPQSLYKDPIRINLFGSVLVLVIFVLVRRNFFILPVYKNYKTYYYFKYINQ